MASSLFKFAKKSVNFNKIKLYAFGHPKANLLATQANKYDDSLKRIRNVGVIGKVCC
jgi:hypothetical protein